ncbi:MAG: flagellar hook capping FlgD N-terminal domain-containing protein [Phycisphaerae bacterium]|nr:flagellar hook capping FlgD N-terminal domain-containing protein [Phycisphaerae bacterium]
MIDTAAGVGIAPSASAPRRDVKSLQSEDFFKLLITELQQQDPLEPSKTEDMIGQVSRIRSIEQGESLNRELGKLAAAQQASGAGTLLGKYVKAEATDDAGIVSTTTGVVTGVRFADDGTTLLDLDSGQTVRLQDVKQVTSSESAGGTGAAAADAPGGPTASPKNGGANKPFWLF